MKLKLVRIDRFSIIKVKIWQSHIVKASDSRCKVFRNVGSVAAPNEENRLKVDWKGG